MPVIGHGADLCTSITRPASPSLGAVIFETDTSSYRWYNGSSWVGMIPEGTVQTYAGSAAPNGWLFCFGQSLNSITSPEYAALFGAIGTTYGGTGASNFVIPDMRGRTVFGKDNMGGSAANRITSGVSGITGTTLGAVGGDQNMQSHWHWYYRVTTSGGSVNASGDIIWAVSGGNVVQQNSGYLRTDSTGTGTGNGNSQNVPPAIILNYIIKY